MMMMVLMVGDDNCIVYSVHGMLQIWLHNTLPRFHSLKTNCVLFTRLFVVLFFCYYMVCLTLACGYCNGLLFWATEHFRVQWTLFTKTKIHISNQLHIYEIAINRQGSKSALAEGGSYRERLWLEAPVEKELAPRENSGAALSLGMVLFLRPL